MSDPYKWFLEMTMRGPFGERYTACIDLDQKTAREFQRDDVEELQ